MIAIKFILVLRYIMSVIHIEEGEEELRKEIIQNYDKLIVFMFTAKWCGPCKGLKRIICNEKGEGLVTKYCDSVVFMYIDVDLDLNESLVNDFQIKSLPTLVFNKIVNEKLVKLDQFEGAQAEKLVDLIENYT